MMKTLTALLTAFVLTLSGQSVGFVSQAYACDGQDYSNECPPPGPVHHNGGSLDHFNEVCKFLPFPIGTVGKPVVFFTQKGDDDCIGTQWRESCQDCIDWIHGLRGPVHGPAANATITWTLHHNLKGIYVPRKSYDRIKKDAGWCWMDKSGDTESHYFNEKPNFAS